MLSKLYYKNKLIIQLISPFENRRLFTALKLNILTLKDYKLWPDKLVALDAFCQTGLQWTRVFSKEAVYLEMWDIDEEAIKYAKKEFPQADVNCGNSIDAIINNKLKRNDYNFILIDSPVPFMYTDGSFEHFKFFTYLFNHTANKAVIMMDVVPDIKTMLAKHPHSDDFAKKWIAARKEFYNVDNGEVVLPKQMTDIYKDKVKKLGIEPVLVTYIARNEFFGILTIVIDKK